MKRTLIEKPNESQSDLIDNILREYNKKQPGYVFPESYMYIYYDDNDKLIGGICFEIQNEWLHIDTLALVDEYRGKGYGSQLLKDAESFGISKGCTFSRLYTYIFQAPKFYEKHGYQATYVRETKNGTLNNYHMVKNLSNNQ